MADGESPSEERPLVVLGALGAVGRGAMRAGAWAWPLLRRGSAALGGALWRRRGFLVALAVRAAWVAALLLFVDAATELVQVEHTFDPMELRAVFALGLGLCSLTVLLAAHRRMRWAGVALGTAHGAVVLMLTALAA